jgi:ATP-dependent exoDNAse (exonuclease V) alpha subunit
MQPTPFELPKYSVPALPFRWVMRESAENLAAVAGTGYVAADEPMDGWKANSTWVLRPENQKRCLEAFWSAIEPRRSLCFFYAKAIPGIEDPRRVLIGAGFVDAMSDLRPYIPGDPEGYGAWVWERPVLHTIRPDCRDGFMLPYQELLARSETDGEIDLGAFAAFVADEHRDEFSYASEHVTPDGALAALNALIYSVEQMRSLATNVPWDRMLSWLNDRLTEVREQRGPCPGLGSALTAFGLSKGAMVAAQLTRELPLECDPWQRVAEAFANPDLLPPALRSGLTTTRRRQFDQLRTKQPKRFDFLRLLSRFAISAAQARLLWSETLRGSVQIEGKEADFLANPYLLYERFRHPVELVEEVTGDDGKTKKKTEIIAPLTFLGIDRGVFLADALAQHHPMPGSPAMEGADDARRLRALVTHVLHDAETREGHTLLPITLLAQRATALKLNPPCEVSIDLIDLFEDDWEEEILFHSLADGKRAAQLAERDEIALDIRNLLQRARFQRGRLTVVADWPELLKTQLGEPAGARDIAAREEKAAALAEMAASRFSVLIGPAGTGKTTLLKALCAEPSIAAGGVLMLAPTGKARVRMQTQTKKPSMTLAQFLVPLGRYETGTGRYRRQPGRSKESRWKTVVVDEASMLTEDQVAALLDAVAGVERFIFVGDPSQLPPIGAGRPFVDLVTALRPVQAGTGPRVATGYAELTIRMRQGGEDPHTQADLRLAELFNANGQGDDEILRELESKPDSPRLRYVRWEHASDLREQLVAVLPKELGVESGDLANLCGTLGATGSDGRWYFNQGAERSIESWQVLSPVKMHAGAGTEELNRTLQKALRGDMLKYASGMMSRNFRVPKPAGAQQAVYGDKVINVMNRNHPYVWPRQSSDGEPPLEYVANGEIGVIIGETAGAKRPDPWRPGKLEIAFGSQPGFRYSFFASSLTDEGDLPIELAYAITVHKAQGSEFPRVFAILPKRAATLCRELLYTALTRHKDKIVVFGQGSPLEMLRFASASASATARRFTNITQDDPIPERRPCPIAVTDRKTGRVGFYERYLVHQTRAGFLVRSKSEVIIANELDHAREKHGLSYEYEGELPSERGGAARYPDFTIRDDVKGRVYFWEHLGMLRNERYRKAWNAKRSWYAANGVTEWSATNEGARQLIVTVDGDRGEIDAKDVAEKVRALCC